MYSQEQQAVISQAISILESSFTKGVELNSSASVKDYCRLQISSLEHEVFAVLLLNSQHELIEFVELFRGTVDGAAVYPREVAKLALNKNASTVIFTHNHPSGHTEPSHADISITKRLVLALELIEVKVLDHIVVSRTGAASLAEQGLL